MKISADMLSPLTHLFYPHVCTGCGSDLVEQRNLLCLHCLNDLPHTNFAMHANNPVERIFHGRLAYTAAMSEFYFAKGSLIQHLIHAFKYDKNIEIGRYLGTMMGVSLLKNSRFADVDVLVPLPLFASKEFKRGYNQAAVLCKGIAEVMGRPVLIDNIIRKVFTETQTKKHRSERWENVSSVFAVNRPGEIRDKHVLLVDDVVTTGATLEACGAEILKVAGSRLSLATLAYASK